MKSLPFWFIGLGTLFAVAGMVLGIYMGMSEDHSLVDAHAHNNLVGYVTMVIYGVYYRLVPAASGRMLATIHFWVALAGSATIGLGLALTLQGITWLIQVSSVLVLLAMVIFAYTVWTNRAGLTNP
jgi:cbb3-type cytochrome oxidase subunit 1